MIADKYAEYMYGLIDKVVSEIGPREACSDEEKRLGSLFASEVGPVCEKVDKEAFTCNPRVAFGVFPFFVALYFAGLIFYYVLPPVTAALIALVLFIFFFEVVRYWELIDWLLPKKEGDNVAGVVKPRGEVRKRVIFSAHLDSAFEFKLWYWFKNFSIPVLVTAVIAFLLLFGAGLARTVANSRGVPGAGIYSILGIICIALAPVVFLLVFLRTGDLVPGAMDDMAGVSVLAGLAKYLEEARESGGFYPENTEVVLLGMSSEEAGLRGAKRYAARHESELKAIPTYGIFWDGIYDEQYLVVNRREIFPGAKHDPYLVKLAQDTARKNDFEIKTGMIPIGASDAAVFSKCGISAVHLCCQDTSKLAPNYHTRLDTIEYIRPESLAVSLQMSIDMLETIDRA